MVNLSTNSGARRMNGADSLMLLMETPKAYQHTFKVAIIDPSTDPEGWSFDRFREDFASRLHLAPFFRWKYAPTPLGINHPMWIEDPDFDLNYHVRRVACPPPGDHRALCEFMSSIYAYQLDRSRPLWMCWVVEGLADGNVALVTLVHHAYVDGVGAAHVLQLLYREDPGFVPEDVPPWRPPSPPSWIRRLLWGLRDWPGVVLGNGPRFVMGLVRARKIEKSFGGAARRPHPKASMMRQTPINVALSAGRTFVCESMQLADFKTIGKAFDVTINDIFLSCAAGAVRRLLLDKNYDANAHPLIAGTPFAGPRPEGMEGMGNFVTADFCWLHTDIADPLERLTASREAAIEMKAHLRAMAEVGADMNALFQILPPWGARALRWWLQRQQGRIGFLGNIALSNVAGPRAPLYLNRYQLRNWFSIGHVFNGTALNLTLWSYCDKANLCILADARVLPDGWVLYDYFVEELSTLLSLAGAEAQSATTA